MPIHMPKDGTEKKSKKKIEENETSKEMIISFFKYTQFFFRTDYTYFN